MSKYDMLEWLKEKEEWLLFELESPADLEEQVMIQEELKTVRGIKAIVSSFSARAEEEEK